MPVATMPLGDLGYPHNVGDSACGACWDGYPKPCDTRLPPPVFFDGPWRVCPGLIHASFGDEMEDGYWLFTRCDVCGEAE